MERKVKFGIDWICSNGGRRRTGYFEGCWCVCEVLCCKVLFLENGKLGPALLALTDFTDRFEVGAFLTTKRKRGGKNQCEYEYVR